MIQLTLDAAQGQRLKREGRQKVEVNNQSFVDKMRWWAKLYSNQYGMVTSDDVRAYAVSHGLYPTHRNCFGSIFKGKGWTIIGRQPSKLPSNHGREVRVWKWNGDSEVTR